MTFPLNKKESALFVIVALLLTVVLPVMNASGSVATGTLNLWGKYLCYAVAAISVDMLWGYTGLLCLGQGLFFALGGYMLGMYLMLMIGELGGYAQRGLNPNLLPDFLVFLGHTTLPAFWKPFYSLPFAILMVIVVPGVIAAIFGYFAFRSRIKGVYFSILTQALTYGAWLMFLTNDLNMGGNNGFTDFRFIAGADIRTDATKRGLYLASAILLLLVYLACKWLTRTKFGLVQRAVRDSETRVLFSGYAAANYKLFIFVFCAIIAGLGGALYVPQVGIINPGEMMPANCLEMVVWVAVGGRGTLIGPVIGAIGVNALKSWATVGKTADYWLIILGGLCLLVVLLMPKGIVGLPAQIKGYFQRLKDRRETESVPSETAETSPAK
ncbi:MAG TPA: urea ABC transporter permease subunit UrtC [Verrucomicrobiales bacterium]|nr:urea ABC transporter permease subunit UrtC [Verrucomicrobiales bacterium]